MENLLNVNKKTKQMNTPNGSKFVEPEIKVTLFSDDLILADSSRCCTTRGFVGYE